MFFETSKVDDLERLGEGNSRELTTYLPTVYFDGLWKSTKILIKDYR
jgi:hypothetical protein